MQQKGYLETQHSVIKPVPEGGEVIQEGCLLHGVPLYHAVHETQRSQHLVTLLHQTPVVGTCDMSV